MPDNNHQWTDEDINSLANDIRSPDAAVQEYTRRRVHEEFESIVGPLLQTYASDLFGENVYSNGVERSDWQLVIPLTIFGGFGLLVSAAYDSFLPLIPFFALLFACIGEGLLQRARRARYRFEQERRGERTQARVNLLEEALSTVADRSHLSFLLPNMYSGSGAARFLRPPGHPLFDALVRILPDTTGEDAAVFNRSHKRTLLKFLSMENAPLREKPMIAVIKAISRLGDSQFLLHLRELADGPTTSTAALRVREAVRQSVAEMEARLRRERASETMLRASETPAGETTLLRAARQGEETDPRLLLRSHDYVGTDREPQE